MLGLDEALAEVIAAAAVLPGEPASLSDAVGRVLAERVEADGDVPRFDTTAMDGWAVRAGEAVAGATLRIAGVVGAGAFPASPLAPGSAWKVMTGAPLPGGSAAVVPVEEAQESGDGFVRIATSAAPGAHIRRAGEVIARGEALLAPGRRLTPADLAVAAAAGRAHLVVVRRPRVGVLVTGDEIVACDREPGPAEIRNTNGPFLLGAVRAAGAEPVDLGVVSDREPELRRALASALTGGLDILLTTGGVSAGDFDLLPAVLAALGATVLFHKIALRPAKPLLFARANATLVFGLPGNPVSTAVAFDMFVRSALRKVSGASPALPTALEACLDNKVRNKGARLALLPAVLELRGGHLLATPVATRGSHDLAAHARANGLLRVPPESSHEAGAHLTAYAASGSDFA